MPDINDQVERRHNLLNEMTATVGSVLLGLQIGCAQCHDHKYDPISQADFYRLRAVFEPAVPPLKRDVPYNLLAEQKDAPPARFWIRGDHRRPGVEVPAGVSADRRPSARARNSELGTAEQLPRARQSARQLAALALRGRQSAHRPRDGQPPLAAPLRPRDLRHAQRLRPDERRPDASRAARLAGGRAARAAAGS